MNVFEISKNKKKTLRKLIEFYRLSMFNESKHLKYKKNTGKINVCIVEKKKKNFKTIYENYEHYVSTFTFDFLIAKIY